MHQSIAASMLAFFHILGLPTDERTPNPFRLEKFVTELLHTRKRVRQHIDTRRISINLLPYKRKQAIDLLTAWLTKPKFYFREVAALQPLADKYYRWLTTLTDCCKKTPGCGLFILLRYTIKTKSSQN
jgi:hypothetical protein